jgi:hypothetical protein
VPRPMSPQRQAEFDELERFLTHFVTGVKGLDPAAPVHPSNVLREIVVRFGKSKALEGLRQAIGDCIEMTSDRSVEWIREFDRECDSLGLVTLTQLRVRYWSRYKTILKRGRIMNETEYYLIAGIANDLTIEVPSSERSMLEELMHQFEQRVSQ